MTIEEHRGSRYENSHGNTELQTKLGGVVKRTTALAKRSDSYYAGNDSFGKVSFKMKAK